MNRPLRLAILDDYAVVATVASIALVVAWLVIDGELWDRPGDDSPQARERSRLYNASTVLTLMAGVLICYVALYVVNLAWALFVLDLDLMALAHAAPHWSGKMAVSDSR